MPPIQADKDIYYNQSGPSMPLLCNPFLPDLTERACGPMEVDLKGASIVSLLLHSEFTISYLSIM